jgi:hypothetical protein
MGHVRRCKAAIGPARTCDDKFDGYGAKIRGIVFRVGESACGSARHFWSLQSRNLLEAALLRLLHGGNADVVASLGKAGEEASSQFQLLEAKDHELSDVIAGTSQRL